MKINQLLDDFEIWTSIEERALLESIDEPRMLDSLTEREQVIAQQLVRKSLLIRVSHNGLFYVYPNS